MFSTRFSTSTNGSRRNTGSSTTSQGSVTFPSHALRYSVLQQNSQQQQQPSRPPSCEPSAGTRKVSPVVYVNDRLRRFEELLCQKAPVEMIGAAYQEFLRAYESCHIDEDVENEPEKITQLRNNLRFSRWGMSKLLRPEYTEGFVDGGDEHVIEEEDLFDEHEVVSYGDNWCDASFAVANASVSSDDDGDSVDTLSDIIPYYEEVPVVHKPAPFPTLKRSNTITGKVFRMRRPAVQRAVTCPNLPGAHLTRQSKTSICEPIVECSNWQNDYYSTNNWI